MSGQTRDYHYALPEELIASHPPPRREDARMLVLDRASGTVSHRKFSDFPEYLRPGDVTVLNDSRVMRARVWSNDRRTELLMLREIAPGQWHCLGRPGKRLRLGATIEIGDALGRVEEVMEDGERRIAFDRPLDLEALGELPLPPYMKRKGGLIDDERYQTVFARETGSVAAPTAGLHFTPDLLKRIDHVFVTLHVGVGTFRPVSADTLDAHRMHSEEYEISRQAADAINSARRVVAVGTTATRVLESQPAGAGSGASGIHRYFPASAPCIHAGGNAVDEFSPALFHALDACERVCRAGGGA